MIDSAVRLLYFSPTGTTRKILEAIAAGLGEDKAKHNDLTPAGTSIGQMKRIKAGLTIIGGSRIYRQGSFGSSSQIATV